MNKILFFLTLGSAFTFYLAGCGEKEPEGHKLANTYCQSCHQMPSPSLINKKTWAYYVLPKMGSFLGFQRYSDGTYYQSGKVETGLSMKDWTNIIKYFVANAPDSLEGEETKLEMGLKDFEAVSPTTTVKDPGTTYVGILEKGLAFGDAVSQQLYFLDRQFQITDSIKVGQGVVNVHFGKEGIYSLSMGVLYPSDEKRGDLRAWVGNATKTILDTLQRPVFAEYADLNGDNKQDIILCEFGNMAGQLSWFEAKDSATFTKHILRPLPGAVRTQVYDFDKDGKPDIMALMAQGDESILIYYNKGNGQFAEKRVLRFPPSYGSNSFQLVDLNKDGAPDIITTNGDNGDYPPILKPYHGVRVFLNDGNNNFSERVFLHQNGAIKAMAADFDGDGDMDIASISYFPDYHHLAEESFIYWQNQGDFKFKPYTFSQSVSGRWLTMDTGDIDKDGDIDIVLGNAKFPLGDVPVPIMKRWDTYSPSILILKNKRNH